MRCGETPTVFEMTGSDAEILCGEWQTGPFPKNDSEEAYNVRYSKTFLPITVDVTKQVHVYTGVAQH